MDIKKQKCNTNLKSTTKLLKLNKNKTENIKLNPN